MIRSLGIGERNSNTVGEPGDDPCQATLQIDDESAVIPMSRIGNLAVDNVNQKPGAALFTQSTVNIDPEPASASHSAVLDRHDALPHVDAVLRRPFHVRPGPGLLDLR